MVNLAIRWVWKSCTWPPLRVGTAGFTFVCVVCGVESGYVCMCVCVSMLYVYVCMCSCMSVCQYTCMYVCRYICLYVRIRVCVKICVCMLLLIFTCQCLICVFVYMDIYICCTSRMHALFRVFQLLPSRELRALTLCIQGRAAGLRPFAYTRLLSLAAAGLTRGSPHPQSTDELDF